MKRRIELLAPAKTADIGIEAIRHGADAVYIGAPAFGARAAAGNSVDDIRRLCDYAHLCGARVYIALNTILYDDELAAAETLATQLYDAGADALIVQDMALRKLHLPPIALHASTQMDIRTPRKAAFLAAEGFAQLILARELSLDEIGAIHAAVPAAKLEAFVHGALCVSFSGRCFASQECFARSANRGRCAQFCRLRFDLIDGDGRELIHQKHLLSLRDMNRSQSLEEMMDAGIVSFKIEGRLKDVDYVKNTTAYYRRALDAVLARRSDDYERASFGRSEIGFDPDVSKSFNRGFTDYFLHGRAPVHSFDTPKSIGQEIGRVVRCAGRAFEAETSEPLHAGDGLCFFDEQGELQGLRVNRVEGRSVFPATMPRLRVGTRLYRNLDFAFEKTLSKPTAERRLDLSVRFGEQANGFRIEARDESGVEVAFDFDCPKEAAQTPQAANIERQLGKLGTTPFRLAHFELDWAAECFIPSSQLSAVRREMVERLLARHAEAYQRPQPAATSEPKPAPEHLDYAANVANRLARQFYEEHGATDIEPAYELRAPKEAVLMECRHCVRYALGHCKKERGAADTWKEPLRLRLADGRTFPLEFDCKNCVCKVRKPI